MNNNISNNNNVALRRERNDSTNNTNNNRRSNNNNSNNNNNPASIIQAIHQEYESFRNILFQLKTDHTAKERQLTEMDKTNPAYHDLQQNVFKIALQLKSATFGSCGFFPKLLFHQFSGRLDPDQMNRGNKMVTDMSRFIITELCLVRLPRYEAEMSSLSEKLSANAAAAATTNNTSREQQQQIQNDLTNSYQRYMVHQFDSLEMTFDLMSNSFFTLIRNANRVCTGTCWEEFVQKTQMNSDGDNCNRNNNNGSNDDNINNDQQKPSPLDAFELCLRTFLDAIHSATILNSYSSMLVNFTNAILKNNYAAPKRRSASNDNNNNNNQVDASSPSFDVETTCEALPFIGILSQQASSSLSINNHQHHQTEDAAPLATSNINNRNDDTNNNNSSSIASAAALNSYKLTDTAEDSIVDLMSNLVAALNENNLQAGINERDAADLLCSENNNNSRKTSSSSNSAFLPWVIRYYPPTPFMLNKNKKVPEVYNDKKDDDKNNTKNINNQNNNSNKQNNNSNNNESSQTFPQFQLASVSRFAKSSSSSPHENPQNHVSLTVDLPFGDSHILTRKIIAVRTILVLLRVLISGVDNPRMSNVSDTEFMKQQHAAAEANTSSTASKNNINNNNSNNNVRPIAMMNYVRADPLQVTIADQRESSFSNVFPFIGPVRQKPFEFNLLDRLSATSSRKLLRVVIQTVEKIHDMFHQIHRHHHQNDNNNNALAGEFTESSFTFLIEQFSLAIAKMMNSFSKNGFNLLQEQSILTRISLDSTLRKKMMNRNHPCSDTLSIIHQYYYSNRAAASSARALPSWPESSAFVEKLLHCTSSTSASSNSTSATTHGILSEVFDLIEFVARNTNKKNSCFITSSGSPSSSFSSSQSSTFTVSWNRLVNDEILSRFVKSIDENSNKYSSSSSSMLVLGTSTSAINFFSLPPKDVARVTNRILSPIIESLSFCSSPSSSIDKIHLESLLTCIRFVRKLVSTNNKAAVAVAAAASQSDSSNQIPSIDDQLSTTGEIWCALFSSLSQQQKQQQQQQENNNNSMSVINTFVQKDLINFALASPIAHKDILDGALLFVHRQAATVAKQTQKLAAAAAASYQASRSNSGSPLMQSVNSNFSSSLPESQRQKSQTTTGDSQQQQFTGATMPNYNNNNNNSNNSAAAQNIIESDAISLLIAKSFTLSKLIALSSPNKSKSTLILDDLSALHDCFTLFNSQVLNLSFLKQGGENNTNTNNHDQSVIITDLLHDLIKQFYITVSQSKSSFGNDLDHNSSAALTLFKEAFASLGRAFFSFLAATTSPTLSSDKNNNNNNANKIADILFPIISVSYINDMITNALGNSIQKMKSDESSSKAAATAAAAAATKAASMSRKSSKKASAATAVPPLAIIVTEDAAAASEDQKSPTQILQHLAFVCSLINSTFQRNDQLLKQQHFQKQQKLSALNQRRDHSSSLDDPFQGGGASSGSDDNINSSSSVTGISSSIISSFAGCSFCHDADFSFVNNNSKNINAVDVSSDHLNTFGSLLSKILSYWRTTVVCDEDEKFSNNNSELHLRVFASFSTIMIHTDIDDSKLWLEEATAIYSQSSSANSNNNKNFFNDISSLDSTSAFVLIRSLSSSCFSPHSLPSEQQDTPLHQDRAKGTATAATKTTRVSSNLAAAASNFTSPHFLLDDSHLPKVTLANREDMYAKMSLRQLVLFGLASTRNKLLQFNNIGNQSTRVNDDDAAATTSASSMSPSSSMLHQVPVEVLCQQHLLSSRQSRSVRGDEPPQVLPLNHHHLNNEASSPHSPSSLLHQGQPNSKPPASPMLHFSQRSNTSSTSNVNNNNKYAKNINDDADHSQSENEFNFASFVEDFGHGFLNKVSGLCGSIFSASSSTTNTTSSASSSLYHHHYHYQTAIHEMEQVLRQLRNSGTLLARLIVKTLITAACQHIFAKCRLIEEKMNNNNNNDSQNQSSSSFSSSSHHHHQSSSISLNGLIVDLLTKDVKFKVSVQLFRSAIEIFVFHVVGQSSYDWFLQSEYGKRVMNEDLGNNTATASNNDTTNNNKQKVDADSSSAANANANNATSSSSKTPTSTAPKTLSEEEHKIRDSLDTVLYIFRMFPSILVEYFDYGKFTNRSNNNNNSNSNTNNTKQQQVNEDAAAATSSSNNSNNSNNRFYPGVLLAIKILANCPGADDELLFAQIAELTIVPVLSIVPFYSKVSLNSNNSNSSDNNTILSSSTTSGIYNDPVQDYYLTMYHELAPRHLIRNRISNFGIHNLVPYIISELCVETVLEYNHQFFSNTTTNTSNNSTRNNKHQQQQQQQVDYFSEDSIVQRLASRLAQCFGSKLLDLSTLDKQYAAATNFIFTNCIDVTIRRTLTYGMTTTATFQELFESQLDVVSGAFQSALGLLHAISPACKKFKGDLNKERKSNASLSPFEILETCCMGLATTAYEALDTTLAKKEGEDSPKILQLLTSVNAGDRGRSEIQIGMAVSQSVSAIFDILSHQIGLADQLQKRQQRKQFLQFEKNRQQSLQRQQQQLQQQQLQQQQQRGGLSSSTTSSAAAASSKSTKHQIKEIESQQQFQQYLASQVSTEDGILFAPQRSIPSSTHFTNSLSQHDDISPVTGARKSATCIALTSLTLLTRMIGEQMKTFATRIPEIVDHILNGFSSPSSFSSSSSSESVLFDGRDDEKGNNNSSSSSSTTSSSSTGDYDVEIRVCWMWRNIMYAMRNIEVDDEFQKSTWLSWLLHMIDTCRRISSCSKPNSSCRIFMLDSFKLLLQKLRNTDLDCVGALFSKCHPVLKQAYDELSVENVKNRHQKAATVAAAADNDSTVVDVDADDDDNDKNNKSSKSNNNNTNAKKNNNTTAPTAPAAASKFVPSSSTKPGFDPTDPVLFLHPRTVIGFVVYHMLCRSAQTEISQKLFALALSNYLRARVSPTSIYNNNKSNNAKFNKTSSSSSSAAHPPSIFQQVISKPKPSTFPNDNGSEMYVMRTRISEFAIKLKQREEILVARPNTDENQSLLQALYRLPAHDLVAFNNDELHQRSFSLLHQLVKLLLQSCHGAPSVCALECIGVLTADRGFSSDAGLVAAFTSGHTGGSASTLSQDDLSQVLMYGNETETRGRLSSNGESGLNGTGGFFSSSAVVAAGAASLSSSAPDVTTAATLSLLSSSTAAETRDRLKKIEPIAALTRTPYQTLSSVSLWNKCLLKLPVDGSRASWVTPLLRNAAAAAAEAAPPSIQQQQGYTGGQNNSSSNSSKDASSATIAGNLARDMAKFAAEQEEGGSPVCFRVERFKRWDDLGKYCLELCVESLSGTADKTKHDAAAFACQELLRILSSQLRLLGGRAVEDTAAMKLSETELKTYDWFTTLPKRTQSVLFGFTENLFRNVIINTNPKRPPFFTPGQDFKTWITMWFGQLVYRTVNTLTDEDVKNDPRRTRGEEITFYKNKELQEEAARDHYSNPQVKRDDKFLPGDDAPPNPGKGHTIHSTLLSTNPSTIHGGPLQARMFLAMRLLGKNDSTIALSLLPYVVAHIVIFGRTKDIETIRLEIDNVLSYALCEMNEIQREKHNAKIANTKTQKTSSNILAVDSQTGGAADDSQSNHPLFGVANNNNSNSAKQTQSNNNNMVNQQQQHQQQQSDEHQHQLQQRAQEVSLHLAAIFQIIDGLDILTENLSETFRRERLYFRDENARQQSNGGMMHMMLGGSGSASAAGQRQASMNATDSIFRYSISNYHIAKQRSQNFLKSIGNIRIAKAAMLVGNAARALRYLETEVAMPSLSLIPSRVIHHQFYKTSADAASSNNKMVDSSSYHFFLHGCFAALDDVDSAKTVFQHARMPIRDAALAEFKHGDWQTALRLCEVTMQQQQEDHQNNNQQVSNNDNNDDDANSLLSQQQRRVTMVSNNNNNNFSSSLIPSFEHATVALSCMRELGYYNAMSKTASDLLSKYKLMHLYRHFANNNNNTANRQDKHQKQVFQRHLADAVWRLSNWGDVASSSAVNNNNSFSTNSPQQFGNANILMTTMQRSSSSAKSLSSFVSSPVFGAPMNNNYNNASSQQFMMQHTNAISPTTTMGGSNNASPLMIFPQAGGESKSNNSPFSMMMNNNIDSSTVFKDALDFMKNSSSSAVVPNSSSISSSDDFSSSSSFLQQNHIDCVIAKAMLQTKDVIGSVFVSSSSASASSSAMRKQQASSILTLRSLIANGRAQMLSSLRKVQQESQVSLYNDLVSLHLLEDLQLFADHIDSYSRLIRSSSSSNGGSTTSESSSSSSSSSPQQQKRKFASNLSHVLDLRLQSLDVRFAEKVLSAHRILYQSLNSEEKYIRLWLGQAETLQRMGQIDAARNAVTQVVATSEKCLLRLSSSSNMMNNNSSSSMLTTDGEASNNMLNKNNNNAAANSEDLQYLYWRGKLLETKLLHDSPTERGQAETAVNQLNHYISSYREGSNNNNNNEDGATNNINNNNTNNNNNNNGFLTAPETFPSSTSISSICNHPPKELVSEMLLLSCQWDDEKNAANSNSSNNNSKDLMLKLEQASSLNTKSESIFHVFALHHERIASDLRVSIVRRVQGSLQDYYHSKVNKTSFCLGNSSINSELDSLCVHACCSMRYYAKSLKLSVSNAYLALPRLITTWLDTSAFFTAFLPINSSSSASGRSTTSNINSNAEYMKKIQDYAQQRGSIKLAEALSQSAVHHDSDSFFAELLPGVEVKQRSCMNLDENVRKTVWLSLAKVYACAMEIFTIESTCLPSSVVIGGLSQLISRVGHPLGMVDDHILYVLNQLMRSYEQQVMWQIFGPMKAAQPGYSLLRTVNNNSNIIPSGLWTKVVQQQEDHKLKKFLDAAVEVCEALLEVCTTSKLTTSGPRVLSANVAGIAKVMKKFLDPGTNNSNNNNSRNSTTNKNNNNNASSSSVNNTLQWILPLTSTLTPSLSLLTKSDTVFPDFPRIQHFSEEVAIMPSLQRPKRIGIIDNNGRKWYFLCKTKDEPRKDMRLLELCGMINNLFQTDEQCKRRNLELRRYQVTPLAADSGIIEWMPNVAPIRKICEELWTSQGNGPRNGPQALGSFKEKIDKHLARPETIFLNQIFPLYPPKLHLWFHQLASHPPLWYESRKRYTSSLAVWSMIGHEIGLGDRHGENLLLDVKTGEITHVDFACLFDKGENLLVPENVRFRLTPNLIDALGVTGYHGAFEKYCELTISLCMKHKDKIMGVLDTFIYDPLVEWQSNDRNSSSTNKSDNSAIFSAQLLLQRVRGRLEGRTDIFTHRAEWYKKLHDQEVKIQQAMRNNSNSPDFSTDHEWFRNPKNIAMSMIFLNQNNNNIINNSKSGAARGGNNNNNTSNINNRSADAAIMNAGVGGSGDTGDVSLSAQAQVQALIENASSLTNITRMYFWWMAWI